MDAHVRQMYSEVYGILNMLGNYYIEKIPKKLYHLIETQKDKNYNPKYDINTPLENQNVDKQALATIALLHLNYWCDSEEEKQSLRDIFNKNEEIYQNELSQKYDVEKIFKRKEEEQKEKIQKIENEEQLQMVVYKESFIQKVINKIKNIFRRK